MGVNRISHLFPAAPAVPDPLERKLQQHRRPWHTANGDMPGMTPHADVDRISQATTPEETVARVVEAMAGTLRRACSRIEETADRHRREIDATCDQLERELQERFARFQTEIRARFDRLQLKLEERFAALRRDAA